MVQQGQNNSGRRGLAVAASLVAIPIFLAGCAEERPAYVISPDRSISPYTEDYGYSSVTVHEGDSVSAIAARCDTSTDEIARLNTLDDAEAIYPGQVLRVPSGNCEEWADAPRPEPRPRHVTYARYEPPRAIPRPRPDRYDSGPPLRADSENRPANSWWSWWTDSSDGTAQSASGKFVWPVRGPVIEAFGRGRHGERNDGINIATEDGAPIRAAASGVVTYTGNELKGYGNLVLIKHRDGFVTAYAHAGSIRVARGDRVEKGEVIATAGQTGDVDRPQLHFEIRRGVQAVDPQRYLVDRAS